MAGNGGIEDAYALAKERYAAVGVEADTALDMLSRIPVSIHCWQGDDVRGFEDLGEGLDGGGIQATGNYPGAARNADELRADIEQALLLIPGSHRLNLHAIYAETGDRKVARNELQPEHFQRWIEWAGRNGLGLDFNGTFFAHPMAETGFTLSSADDTVRRFWIEHAVACRRIGAAMGAALKSPSVANVWIPDGYKDTPADRKGPRERLRAALDEVFAERIDRDRLRDAVESKLFGIGSESYVVGSHEFYLGYAVTGGALLCLDTGHFHPTEVVSDKISAVFQFVDEILLHVSRGVRWDSDHVVTLSDELRTLAAELARGDYLDRTHIGLDFFDASINRVAAWVIGTRNMIKALLAALLEPSARLAELEERGDYTARLALAEELKSLPFGAVWDYYCTRHSVPVGIAWLDEVRQYERTVLRERS